ncbi:MAG: fibronectin type III domain-containing protein, partial [Balneolales bacterium]
YVTQVCGTNPGDTSVAVGAQSFTTLCNVFGFPFLEDFESGSSSLSCWSQDVVGAGWQITSNQANSGSQSYYHNDDSGAQSDRLISPAIDLTGAVNPQLVFWEYDNFSSFYDNHEVAISTDGGSTWSAPIYNQAGVEDTWTEVVLDVSAYAGQTIHVGFLYEGDFSDEWYIDDFELREAPTCVAPTALSAQNISVDEATAIWTAGIGAVSYIVEFDTVGFNTGEGTLVAVNDTFAVLSGLDANTDYEFYVSQVCGTNPGDTTTAAGPEAFTTQCAALMAPYSENFDTTGGTVIPDNGPLPDCWTGIVVDASGTATLEVDIAGDNGGSPSPAISSPNIIELTTDDAGDTVVLVSPAFSDLGAQDKRIRFYAQRDDHLGDLFIGTMTDANDLSTFMPYDTILNSELLDGTWAEFTVNFDTYAGGTAHIAFMQIEPNPFSDTYIDNFVYEKIPSCFAPTALSSQGITESEASVYWTSASGAASFIVEYDTAGFTPGSGNIMTPTDTFVNLSGLDANTAYDFYVTQVCGTNPGDTSAVAGPVSFTTECEAVASFPWTETFENSSTTRSCWANIYESGTADWTYDIGSSGGAISAPFAGALNARFVSQSGTNNPATKLVSPVLDLSGLTNPEVEFYYGQEEWFGDQNTLHVFYRVSPSDPWVLIADYTSEAAVWTQETLLLPNPSSTYQLAFEGRNNYGRANVLDNVTVQAGPSCPPVTDLTVSNITATEATLSWTPSNSDTSYLVAYDTTGAAFEDMNNVFATSNATLNISGLDASTGYDFYVLGVCGTNVGDTTLVGPETFTTTAACDVPTALSTQNISSDEATATWTAGTGAVSYIVEYDTAGFTPGDGNVLTPTDTFVNLTGLDALTEYEFYVTQVCGTNPGDTTAAVGPETFATLCAAVMAPYQENFDGSSWTPGTGFDNSGDAIDPCWSRNPATSSDFFWGTRTGTTGSGSTGPDSDNTTGSGNYIFTEGSNGGTGDIATITSPQIDLSSLTVPQLLFAYHFYGANTDSFWVEVYDGTVWTLIDTITGTQQTDNSDPWLIRELDLSAFAGSTVQVRFSAIRGTSFNADYALDDIWIRETPSCIVPSSLAAQDITETEATLFWTASPGAASFIVEYDTAGFTPGDGNVLTPTDTFVNLTGLSASTDYEFYVTQVCGANPGDTSFVVGPESFRTACGVELAPFFENFDGAVWVAGSGFNNAGSEIDPCWTSNPPLSPDYYWGVGEGTTGTSFSTGPDGDNTTGIGNYVFTESSNGSTGDIATFTSPQIDLSPLTVPQLLYAYHFYGATIDTFLVSVDDGNGYVFIDTIIGEQQADNPEPWLIRELDLSAFAGATVNVRFTARKGGTSCDYAIDDFWIRETPSCNVPTALSSQDITENSATVSWTGTSGAVSYILEYDTAGFTPGDGNFITPTDTFSNLTGLMSNTEYDFYVTQACGTNPGDTSLQVGPATFTTSCNAFTAPYSENFDSIAGVVIPDNGPLPDCWTGIVVDASGTAT